MNEALVSIARIEKRTGRSVDGVMAALGTADDFGLPFVFFSKDGQF